MDKKPLVAVIGCGYWGKNLIRNFSQVGVLTAVSDLDDGLARKYSDEYDVAFKSNQEIFDDPTVTAVAVAVPAGKHYDVARQALCAGKHVFVEKPLTIKVEDAEKLCQLAEAKEKKLMVGHILRYHGIFRKMHDMVRNNEIGKLRYIYSSRLDLGKMKSEKNVLWSLAPHDVSLILALTEVLPEKVYGHKGRYLQDDIDDIAHLHMEFSDNLKAHIFVSWLNPFKEQKLVVIGEDSMLVFDDCLEWKKKLFKYDYHLNGGIANYELSRDGCEYIQVEQTEPLYNECEHFVDCIIHNTTPDTDGREALRVLNVINDNDKIK